MLDILRFWLIIQFFSVAVLPLAWRWLGALPSRGYALAKPLGLLLVTYVLWLGASLGLLRNSTGGILFSWALVLAVSWWLGRDGIRRQVEISPPPRATQSSSKGEGEPEGEGDPEEVRGGTVGRPIVAWLRENWAMVVLTEVLFLAALAAWAAVRSYSPEITTAGGEKFMELTFLNGILRSDRFPPLDPWLSGFAISYYYFGYVMLAVLTRLSGLAPSIAFNVGLATWFALTVTAAFGVAFDMAAALVRSKSLRSTLHAPRSAAPFVGGLLGALFVSVLSNLEGFLESLHSLGLGSVAFWRWLDIKDLNCLGGPNFTEPIADCLVRTGIQPDRFFWWWRASRVVNDRDLLGNAMEVIDEFPFFSFLLGDMHPHVLGLPFVLLAVGIALALLLGVQNRKEEGGRRNEVPERSGVEEEGGTKSRSGAEWRGQGAGGEGQGAGGKEQGERAGAYGSGIVRSIVDVFPLGWVGIGLTALCLGGLGFLNTWDFPIYLFLVMLALGARLAWDRGGLSWGVAGRALLAGAGLLVLGMLLYLPFFLGFQSQAGGILPNFLFGTRLSQFFVMFGPLLVAAILLLIALSEGARQTLVGFLRFLPFTVLAPIVFLVGMLAIGLLTPGGQDLIGRLRDLPMVQELGNPGVGQLLAQVGKVRLGSPWAYLLIAALLAWVLALLSREIGRSTDQQISKPTREQATRANDDQAAAAQRSLDQTTSPSSHQSTDVPVYQSTNLPSTFALLALLTALLLVFSVEFVYLRDTFGTRMNTVFKFYFQAWVLMALVAAFAVVYVAKYAGRIVRWVGLPVLTLLVVAALFYPVFGTYTRAERFAREPTLDGTAYLAQQNPGDEALIAWLRQNVPGNAVVLEAPGGSYSYAGRISAQTGLPTLLGWDGHELQWRGNTEQQDLRRPDVDRIYRSAMPAELEQLLARWGIDYVVVGDLERQTYGVTPQSEARLAQVMDLVYDAGGVRVYRTRS